MSNKEEFIKKLTSIEGIGKAKALQIYENGFDSIEKISKASIEDLAKVKGVSKDLAKKIKDNLVEEKPKKAATPEKKEEKVEEIKEKKEPEKEEQVEIVEEEKKYTIRILEEGVLKQIEKEVNVVTISNTSSRSGENCIYISNTNLSFTNFGAVNSSGENVNGELSGGNIYISWVGEPLMKLYSFEEELIIQGASGTASCMVGEIKNIREDKYILEEDLKELLTNYSEDYEAVRSTLGIPLKDEFNINFDNRDGTILGGKAPGIKGDIYAEKTQIVYLDKYANKKLGDLILYVW